MKVAITGVNGFVGKNLLEQLNKNLNIYPIRHSDLDLLDYSSVVSWFNCNNVDIVLHCANVGGSRASSYDKNSFDIVEKNMRMFFNLIKCLRSNQRLISLGSGAEYDYKYYQPKMSETYFGKYVPADAYGFSKYVISQFISNYKNMLCLRIFGLFGPYEDYRYKFISNSLIKNIIGMPIVINQDVVFDYLYIKDFVQIIERLLYVDWPYRHMNITPTESIKLSKIAEIINDQVDKKSEIKILHEGMNKEYTGNNSRLLDVIGPFIFTPISKAVQELRNYYERILNDLDLEIIRSDPFISKCRTNKT